MLLNLKNNIKSVQSLFYFGDLVYLWVKWDWKKGNWLDYELFLCSLIGGEELKNKRASCHPQRKVVSEVEQVLHFDLNILTKDYTNWTSSS